ncbi:MAG: hypothetical protein IJ084_01970 [Prevotella sp.]|nr:hypothetical protein [Prevotella sp.]
MKKFLSKHALLLSTLAFGLMVFLFWGVRYPFALTYQEQLQLFLFDSDYFCGRMAEPGGFARYIAEFLVQFYNGVVIGALILALLYMLVQRLTWRLMKTERGYYLLSFIPTIILWYAMGDENVMLTCVVALVLAMAAALGWRRLSCALWMKWVMALVLIPVLYWLLGPVVLLVAVLMCPLSVAIPAVVYALALMLLSAHYQPFPMSRILLGISYYRVPEVIPYSLMAILLVIALLSLFSRKLPQPKRWMVYAQAVVVAMLLLVPQKFGFDTRKYDLIEYDHLVRVNDWNSIIRKAEQQMPDLPMSVSATNLALGMTNQLGERAFDFYQRGTQGLLPRFERNFATTQLTGEIYFHLGLVNTAQRLAFEAMEAIPNYNKSARVLKRLVETNMINGQYKVAEKYIRMLEKTIFYRPWAGRMRAMLGDEKAINAHPLYGTLRHYRLQEDFLFSDTELDRICGQLFMHDHQNQMAAQYLLMIPLLEKDVPRFMQYAQYVQSQTRYNPRSCQEAIAFGFMQQRQQSPQGLVSPLVLQQLNDFSRIYSAGGKDAPGLQQFRNTVWYYLVK